MIVDYHMHLRDSDERIDYSVEAVEKFVETAAERGVDEIGFTEHVYYFEQTDPSGNSSTCSSAASTISTSTWGPW